MERRNAVLRAVAICVLILTLTGWASAQYGGGTGTPDDAYLITTPEQMNAIGADPNDWDKHFKLTADIDLSAYTGTEFNIIGRDSEPFRGTFDGDGHTISGFTYTSNGADYTGLFGNIYDPNAEIRSLGLIGPRVDGRRRDYVGALVGHLEDGHVTGCHVQEGTVSGSESVGGLVGRIGGIGMRGRSRGSSGMVTRCYCTCEVRGTYDVGGLAGYSAGSIANCHATGVVRGSDSVGGLVGYGRTMTYWSLPHL